MSGRNAILTVGALATAAAVLVLGLGTGKEEKAAPPPATAAPGEPSVTIVSPRNGARQKGHAVVVKTEVHDFQLSGRHFGGEPELGEGNIRFGLNRVPDCVYPAKLKRAIESPFGNGRLIGRSFDYARFSGPNGVLAERIGSAGSFSPATRPEIYYHGLPAGFYRLVVTLAQNDGSTTPYHAVTNFQILSAPGHGPHCTGGKVPSVKAAAFG
jgi:hypothetical protein